MLQGNTYKSFEVIYRKENSCPLKKLHFSFFQMVYIISGDGFLLINGNKLPYRQANFMLLNSKDSHSFEVSSPTEFLLIRFMKEYISEYKWKSTDHLESLLYYSTHLSGCVINNDSDGIIVNSIINSILLELSSSSGYDEDLLSNFINALIVIAARNIISIKPKNVTLSTDKKLQDIVDYIQTNIYFPDKIKAAVIGELFSISETYLGSYFKKQCGETMQHFISNYRIRLIEHRLRFSSMRVNEIVNEFSFSDESHLNKFFKKHKGISLTGFRKTIF